MSIFQKNKPHFQKNQFFLEFGNAPVPLSRFWKGSCNTPGIAAVQPRRLVVLGTKSPALSSSVKGGNRRRKDKEQEGSAPSNSTAGESHLPPGKPVCRL